MDFSQYVKGNALEISNTTIDISELVSFLQSNAHITKLSLEGAGIGDKGAEALAKLTNLTLLDLDNNGIGDKGAEALANSNLTHLIELYLSFNKIGDKGAEALANSSLINLTSLNLEDNSISGTLTAEVILASLKQKREIVKISNRIMEEKLEEERQNSQNRLREMEERHQADITLLREESHNRLREMEERHQTELTRLREENQNKIKEMEDKHQTQTIRLREENQNTIREMEESQNRVREIERRPEVNFSQYVKGNALEISDTTIDISKLVSFTE